MRNRLRKKSSIRSGTIYVMVLSIAMLVTVIGVGAITAVRVQLRNATMSNDAEEARVAAQSGIELGRWWINADPTWRTDFSSGGTNSGMIGAASVSVNIVDPTDGDFTNSPFDPVQMTATGTKGLASQQIRVMLVPSPVACTSLTTALTAGGGVTLTSGTTTSSGNTIAAIGNLSLANAATLDANGEATGTCNGTNYIASKTSGATARTLPDTTVFDYYIKNGTAIPFGSIGGGNLQNCVLSPASNPFGLADPNGIYVINCGGSTINVKNIRVVGTLVILDCKSDSQITNQVNFAPAIANYPTLMVRGAINMKFDAGTLAEGGGKNFNPPGTPYNGTSNTTTNDTYPSIINGLTYISGALDIAAAENYGGPIIVGGTAMIEKDCAITYDPTYANNPPPGFTPPPAMIISPNSWKQTVN